MGNDTKIPLPASTPLRSYTHGRVTISRLFGAIVFSTTVLSLRVTVTLAFTSLALATVTAKSNHSESTPFQVTVG